MIRRAMFGRGVGSNRPVGGQEKGGVCDGGNSDIISSRHVVNRGRRKDF
jgi:hypothetical protein